MVGYIVKGNWKCILMQAPGITEVFLHGDEQQEPWGRETETERLSPTRVASLFPPSLLSFIPSLALSVSQMHTLSFAPQRRMRKQSTERRPHSDIFICVVLTRLNSPSERLMRRNGLVEEPTGCIHSCHHHLNPGLLNPQLWPPAWMGNDLSVLGWHPLRLQGNRSSPVRNNTDQLNLVGVDWWCFFHVRTDVGLVTSYSMSTVPVFVTKPGLRNTRGENWKTLLTAKLWVFFLLFFFFFSKWILMFNSIAESQSGRTAQRAEVFCRHMHLKKKPAR